MVAAELHADEQWAATSDLKDTNASISTRVRDILICPIFFSYGIVSEKASGDHVTFGGRASTSREMMVSMKEMCNAMEGLSWLP